MNAPSLNPAFAVELLSRVEDAGINASAPPQQLWLDGWLVRFSPGKAKRARCINAVAEGRLSLHDRVEACHRVLATAGLPLLFRITPFTLPAGLDAQLSVLGMPRIDDTRVMVLADLPHAAPPLPPGMSIEAIGLEAFAHRVGGFRGSPLAQRQAQAHRLRESPVPFQAYEIREDGAAVGCGQLALEGTLVGLYDVFTVESARGRGLASLLCRHLLARARAQGARQAYLQVEGDNAPARAVYARIGFQDGYAYHYRTTEPEAG
ncbi:MAG: GNAT family N-acetyltransferase [Pseudomonadota bacterium]|nr:GNAT family N-acetyltransferase [Pseudomonadota bacterium]